MKYSVIYSSKTGNTDQLAEQIVTALGEPDCIMNVNVNVSAINENELMKSDLICAGSWTDKGTFDEKVLTVLATLENKKLFLFGSCGFGGSEIYYEQIMDRVRKAIPQSCTIVGTYMCQGKMPASVRSRYEKMLGENPEDSKMKQMIENFDRAMQHPDQNDLTTLAQRIRAIAE